MSRPGLFSGGAKSHRRGRWKSHNIALWGVACGGAKEGSFSCRPWLCCSHGAGHLQSHGPLCGKGPTVSRDQATKSSLCPECGGDGREGRAWGLCQVWGENIFVERGRCPWKGRAGWGACLAPAGQSLFREAARCVGSSRERELGLPHSLGPLSPDGQGPWASFGFPCSSWKSLRWHCQDCQSQRRWVGMRELPNALSGLHVGRGSWQSRLVLSAWHGAGHMAGGFQAKSWGLLAGCLSPSNQSGSVLGFVVTALTPLSAHRLFLLLGACGRGSAGDQRAPREQAHKHPSWKQEPMTCESRENWV